MPIMVLSDTPDMTREQFDIVATDLGLRESLPDGCLAFISGVGPDGATWRDTMIWESASQAKEFMDTRLRPTIDRIGATAILGPPVNWEVNDVLLPSDRP